MSVKSETDFKLSRCEYVLVNGCSTRCKAASCAWLSIDIFIFIATDHLSLKRRYIEHELQLSHSKNRWKKNHDHFNESQFELGAVIIYSFQVHFDLCSMNPSIRHRRCARMHLIDRNIQFHHFHFQFFFCCVFANQFLFVNDTSLLSCDSCVIHFLCLFSRSFYKWFILFYLLGTINFIIYFI